MLVGKTISRCCSLHVLQLKSVHHIIHHSLCKVVVLIYDTSYPIIRLPCCSYCRNCSSNPSTLSAQIPSIFAVILQMIEYFFTDGSVLRGEFSQQEPLLCHVLVAWRKIAKGKSLTSLLCQHGARCYLSYPPSSSCPWLLQEGRLEPSRAVMIVGCSGGPFPPLLREQS